MLNVNGNTLATDTHGYLKNTDDWSETVAQAIAAQEGLVLTEEHWQIIHFVREFYLKYNTSPAMRTLTKAIARDLGEEKGNSRHLYKLFPKGPAKIATKIAGLPKPVRCI